MRSKYIFVPAIALGLALSAVSPVAAQTAAGTTHKIAVLDMQGALLQTKDGQKAAAELKTKFGPKETEITKRQQDLQAKADAFRKNQATLAEDARAKEQRDIETLTRDLQRDAEDAKADFQNEENRLLGGIMQKMQTVLQKYAADNQLAMIVDISTQPNNLLYADQSTNITSQVIALYDKAAAVSPAAPPAAGPAAPATAAPKRPATPAPKPAAK